MAQTQLPEVNVTAPAPTAPAQTLQTGPNAPYARRAITLTFQLAQGSFSGSGGANTVTVQGLRVHFQCAQVNMPSPTQATIRVFGLTLSQINQLTRAGTLFNTPGNTQNNILVQAGDYGQSLTTVYKGVIYEAYPDFNSMPDTAFVIIANPAFGAQLKAVAPTSFAGAVPASQALQQVAQLAGVTLENNGVNATLQSPYFPGTPWQQMLKAIQSANCFAFYDGQAGKLAIWPKSGSRQGPTKMISSATGMIGYPEFMQARLKIRMIFDPSLQGIGPGHVTTVQSQLQAANGSAIISQVDYDLESEMPGGPWEMSILAIPQKAAAAQ